MEEDEIKTFFGETAGGVSLIFIPFKALIEMERLDADIGIVDYKHKDSNGLQGPSASAARICLRRV